jgi:hypothetical protein
MLFVTPAVSFLGPFPLSTVSASTTAYFTLGRVALPCWSKKSAMKIHVCTLTRPKYLSSGFWFVSRNSTSNEKKI